MVFVCPNGYGFVDRVRTGRQSGDKNERHLILGQGSGAFLSYLVSFIQAMEDFCTGPPTSFV